MNESQEFTLRDYFHIIGKRKHVVIAVTILMVLSVGVYTYLQKPVYRSTGQILINQSPNIIKSGSPNRDPLSKSKNVFIQKIKSADFILKVKKSLLENKDSNIDFSVINPSTVANNIRVYFNEEEESISLIYDDHDRDRIHLILNRIMEYFIVWLQQYGHDSINSSVEFLKTRLDIIRDSLLKSENELKEFQKNNNVFSLPSRIIQLQEELIKLDSQKATLVSSLNEIDYTLEHLKKEFKSKVENNKEYEKLLINPKIRKLEDEIAASKEKLAEYSQLYSPQHPKVQEIKDRISSLQEEFAKLPQQFDSSDMENYRGVEDPILKTIIQNVYELKVKKVSNEVKISTLDKVIENKKESFSNLPESNLAFARLERKLKVTEALYSTLLVRYNEAQLEAATMESKAKILFPATQPSSPIKPNMKNNLIVSLLAGIIIGLSFAFLVDTLDNTIRSPEEGKKLIKLPVMGMIPLLHKDSETQKELSGNIDPILITYHYPQSVSSESFRGLRTNLMFYQQQNESKTFMITNASQAKGKTTIISNLAISIAYTGKKVLLVDADLRKPYLHKLFRISNNVGLTSIFYGTNPEDAVQKTLVEGLNILSSGPIPPNPSELLSSTTMDEIINFFSDKYDIILFDSTPVVAVTDASILSSKVDCTLFMVCVRDDSKQQVKKGMDILKQVNANTMGVVYNKVRERELGGYYYRYA